MNAPGKEADDEAKDPRDREHETGSNPLLVLPFSIGELNAE
jgi:hypothetical protein